MYKMYKNWMERIERGFNKKRWSQKYYIENRKYILSQQKGYRDRNRQKILALRRQRYLKKRTSYRPIKPYKPRKRKIEHIKVSAEQKRAINLVEAKFELIEAELNTLPSSRRAKIIKVVKNRIRDIRSN
jgi:hypothetical protein